jgi:putative secretion ATPase (PEP-CTERM system associated)
MYQDHYGFRGSPFQLVPDARFFYESSAHGRASAHLTFGLSQGEGFVVITGEVGAGKTMLVERLWTQLKRSTYTLAQVNTTQLSGDDLFRMAMSGFGVEHRGRDKSTMLLDFKEVLRQHRLSRRRCLLVVDEAQNLSLPAIEELRMLSNITEDGRVALQTILLGQPQFRQMLASPDLSQLRQRVLASYHLGPLTEPETRAYVEHRLATVGWTDNPRIEDDAFVAIHRHSGGIPRQINRLCGRVLLLGALEQADTLTEAMVEDTAQELNQDLEGVPPSLQREAPADRDVPMPGRRPPLATAPPAVPTSAPVPKHADGPLVKAEPAAMELQPVALMATPHNAMTVDVEDWFQVQAYADVIPRGNWNEMPCRVEDNTDRMLALFAAAGVQGTFFTLGWVAERYPALVRRIVAGGHELASHGYGHARVDSQDEDAFRADIRRARQLLEDIGGVAVRGYRAPTFSIGPRTPWAWDVLAEEGYSYSSSVYPVRHDLYGEPDAPRVPHRRGALWEVPMTTLQLRGRNLPVSGGGWFRLVPYSLSRLALRQVNARGERGLFYIHPWEIDPGQPHVTGARLLSRLRHRVNLAATETRMAQLLADFSWGRMDRTFPELAHG